MSAPFSPLTRPYHASASERIAGTEARLGRRIQSARELPDDMSRALWWKKRRDYFAGQKADLRGSDNDHLYNIAFDEHAEAESAYDLLIREMWAARFADRENRAWLKLRPALVENAVNDMKEAAL